MVDVEVITEVGTGLLADPSWDAFAAMEGTAFHTSHFLLPWWYDRLAKNPMSQLVAAKVLDGEAVVGICAFELDSGVLSFAGGRDVVDYMGPAAASGREKEVVAALAEWFFDGLEWTKVHLGGLVHNEAMTQELAAEVLRRVPDASVETYDQAPRIEEAPEGYLSLLNSKRRGEVLRKRNRLTEAVGELELVASTRESASEALEQLLAWKARASPAMSGFVVDYGGFVRTLVAELAAVDAGHVMELRAGSHRLASAIVLSHARTKYLYNMSYDMALTADAPAGLAPGVVLVSYLVEQSLDLGLRFDFLKGAQDYKLRLGGTPVDLAVITAKR